MNISLIVAVDDNNGIAKDSQISWPTVSTDLNYFRTTTTRTNDPNKQNAVIMGLTTYNNLPSKYKPLPDRYNAIITKNNCKSEFNGHWGGYFESPIVALNHIKTIEDQIENVFVIGGEQIYNYFIKMVNNYIFPINKIYITRISGDYKCNKFFPPIPEYCYKLITRITHTDEKTNIPIAIEEYNWIHPEYQYHTILRNIAAFGNLRQTRNAKVKSLFNNNLTFDLSYSFPLFTTKKVFMRGVFEELMWILRGQTNVKFLQEKNVHIWDANSTREFLDAQGLQSLPEGEIGPTYGAMMRNFEGTDQLTTLIEKIKNNPNDRRLMINLWHPGNIDKCALPPCLYGYQFYCPDEFRISVKAFIRSSDVPVALGWNVATISLFLSLVAHQTNRIPYMVYITIGDYHIYEPHFEEISTILERQPYSFPMLKFVNNPHPNITDYEYSDIKIMGYKSHSEVKLKMVA